MATLYEKVKKRNKRARNAYRKKKLSSTSKAATVGGMLGAFGRNAKGLTTLTVSKGAFGAAAGYLAAKAKKENTLYRSKGWKNMAKRQAVMEKTAYRITSARKAALRKAQQASARLRRK